ncbi:MAG: glycogen/starch/alpha-glucan phosphorylase, partial [Candidatus Omnitrophica bacterium]|nr:glycogen/starch/alpha-glucan phosphorylase [Candidatus Omnitrophota bacterium]
IFGLRCDDVRTPTVRGYRPQDYGNATVILREAISLIQSNFFCINSADLFKPLTDNLIYSDPYCVCADFDDYYKTQGQVGELYHDAKRWTQKSIINVARCGFFSSDRAVSDYAKDIWKVKSVRI